MALTELCHDAYRGIARADTGTAEEKFLTALALATSRVVQDHLDA